MKPSASLRAVSTALHDPEDRFIRQSRVSFPAFRLLAAKTQDILPLRLKKPVAVLYSETHNKKESSL
ncbi:MAG: hypothetical protein E7055_20710 [Lentisphaerae bacterium]|nr:hypothetical protein [Lentisphaerota bacterium]